MKLVALFIGIFIAAVGILGFTVPSLLLEFARSLLTPAGLYIVAVGRVGVGLLFLQVAASSRAPLVLRALGVLMVIAGVLTPVFGVERSLAVLDWLASDGGAAMRMAMSIPVVVGAFVIYAVAPRPISTTGVH